jgi:hypothetical protein
MENELKIFQPAEMPNWLIEINPDGKMTIEGKFVVMPYTQWQTQIESAERMRESLEKIELSAKITGAENIRQIASEALNQKI